MSLLSGSRFLPLRKGVFMVYQSSELTGVGSDAAPGFARKTHSTPRMLISFISRAALTVSALRSSAETVCWVTPKRKATSAFKLLFNN